MALQHNEQKDQEDNVEIQAGRFLVQSTVQQQKLFLSLRDKITKKLFKSSFTSSELKECGFNEGQSKKLETIGRLIQAAQAKQNGCKLDIKIPQDQKAADGFCFAEVIIIRQDGMFGDVSYKLKLDEVTRDAPDVNADLIDDIKEDVNYLREQIDTLTADLSLAKQHTLPKGTIIDWYGTRKNIPKFWEVSQDDDNKDDEAEDEETNAVKDIFTYESDFDENGIIFALGSAYGTQDWQNPSETEIVDIRTAARMGRVSKPKHYLINREPGIVAYVSYAEYNWFSIDFKDISIRPTNYTLRHDNGPNNEGHLRNWQLQGSNDGDGNTWDVLMTHNDDLSLNEPDATHTWTIQDITTFYRYIRIKMTGPASSRGWYLSCSGFEIYGEVKREDDDCGAPKKMYTLIKTV